MLCIHNRLNEPLPYLQSLEDPRYCDPHFHKDLTDSDQAFLVIFDT